MFFRRCSLFFLFAAIISCGGGSPERPVPSQQAPEIKPALKPDDLKEREPSKEQPQKAEPENATPTPNTIPSTQLPVQPSPTPSPSPPSSNDFANDPNVVRDVNAIVEQLNVTLPNLAQFRRSGLRPNSAQIVLLGENHIDETGLVDQFRALKKLAKPKDIILLEGNAPQPVWQDCDRIVFRLYASKRWNQRHPDHYDAKDHFELQKVLDGPWRRAGKALNLKTLGLKDFHCNFWDTATSGHHAASLRIRNQSMVDQIRRHMASGRNIFVLTGYAHLPMGDLHEFKVYFYKRLPEAKMWYQLQTDRSLLNLKQPEFYVKLNTAPVPAKARQENLGFGTTEALYTFLRDQKYSELIPRYLLTHADLCGEECD